MLNNIKAALFDLDGVVVFTDKYHYLGWKKLSDEQGWFFDEGLNHRLRGISRLDSLKVILEYNKINLSHEQMIEFSNRKDSYYRELLCSINESDIYAGSVEFIKMLRNKGVKIALCSASKNAKLVLEKLNIENIFDVVVTGNDVNKSKPDPEIFLLAAERLNIHPFNCVVFEDAQSGIDGALAAHMKCIGVGNHGLNKANDIIINYEEIDVDAFVESGHKKTIKPHPWSIVDSSLEFHKVRYWESVLALSNGYLGLRGTCEEEDDALSENGCPGMFINGFYEQEDFGLPKWAIHEDTPEFAEKMVNLMDWRIINLYVDGQRFSMFKGKLHTYKRELDMKRGVVVRSMLWEADNGRQVEIRITRLVSMTRVHQASIRYEVTPVNFSGEILLESKIHGCQMSNRGDVKRVEQSVADKVNENLIVMKYKTVISGMSYAGAFSHICRNGKITKQSNCVEGDMAICKYAINTAQGETVILEKFACFYSQVEADETELIDLAMSEVSANVDKLAFDRMLKEQEDFWEDYWKTADIEIGGNIADQQAVRFNIFHLRQCAYSEGLRSISANGLTGENYMGWVFWDTEMFMIPQYNYTDPKLVKSLLMFRYNTLDRARERATELQYKGAAFPWCTITGKELSADRMVGFGQVHINNDIAYAIWRYYCTHKDKNFLYHFSAEIVFETARYMADLGEYVPARGNAFCINYVCGPDEYSFPVNNNCYTNFMTKKHLEFAADIYSTMRVEAPDLLEKLKKKINLSDSEVDEWKEKAERMYIPFNAEIGVHEQDDTYMYRYPVDFSYYPKNYEIKNDVVPLRLGKMQVTKQADIELLMFTCGDRFSNEMKRNNYYYYESRTLHASSLSPAVYGIGACEIDLFDEAYDFFRQACYLDLYEFKNNTDGGLHMACAGGTWMAVINGFAGMRDYDSGLSFNLHLPKEWENYKFKILHSGNLMEIFIDREKVCFQLLEGEGIRFSVYKKEVKLDKNNREFNIRFEKIFL